MDIRRPLHSDVEELVIAKDEESGLHAIIAIHSTLLGPAICGTRFYPYSDEKVALDDATRIAKQFTYRSALANIPFGGAYGIIIDSLNKKSNRDELYASYGKLVDKFEGRVLATADLNCMMGDIDTIKKNTPFAAGGNEGAPGDPSYFTALGLFRGIEAAANKELKTNSLSGLKVALMGVGHVGVQLAEMLHIAGAKLIVADIMGEHLDRAREEFNAETVRPRDITEVACDIFCPCALGRVLDDRTIPKLKCKIVAGSANNQLAIPFKHSRMLHQRRIVYVPDFAVNVGSLYTNVCELNDYGTPKATILTNGLYDTIDRILQESRKEDRPTYEIAMRIVENKMRRARALRITKHL